MFLRWIYDMGPGVHWTVLAVLLFGGAASPWFVLPTVAWWVLVAVARGRWHEQLKKSSNESGPE